VLGVKKNVLSSLVGILGKLSFSSTGAVCFEKNISLILAVKRFTAIAKRITPKRL